MDIDANLKEQLAIMKAVIDGAGNIDASADLERLADLVEAMDGWLSNGGALPKRWQR